MTQNGFVSLLILAISVCLVICNENFTAAVEPRVGCSERGAKPQPPNRVFTRTRLQKLRKIMNDGPVLKTNPIDAYIVPATDEHQTEYVAEYEKRRKYISGFSGSRGDAIIAKKSAVVWTDSRYLIQANDQLDCHWTLIDSGEVNAPDKVSWLKSTFKENQRIGFDPKLTSASEWLYLREGLANSSLTLVDIEENLIDMIWDDRQKVLPKKDAFIWDIKYAGKNWTEKVAEVRNELSNLRIDAMVVTALDEIAWLLNIRGRDTIPNPFVQCYLILSNTEVRLYIDQDKLTDNEAIKTLNNQYGISKHSIMVYNYNDIWNHLPTLSQSWNSVLLPSECAFSPGVSYAIYKSVPEPKQVLLPSPIIYLKAQKNKDEIEGMQQAHIRDGAAMCIFLEYFERTYYGDPPKMWDELEVVKILNRYRFEQHLSLGNSFNTIVGFGTNGAKPHYEPTKSTNKIIFNNSTLVIDSGGQYYDGTTDVTRTLHLGTPTDREKKAYTTVLMGSIQFSSLTFPSDIPMSLTDIAARAPLWEQGMDYAHSTGHGIGVFLVVHESPIDIIYSSKNIEYYKPGYFLSNEPGYYREGDFGIRLENVLKVTEKPWLKHSSSTIYLGFEDMTLVPYEPKLIDLSLLSVYHRRWLNKYNARIRRLVGAELKRQGRMEAFYWMMNKTKDIPENGSGSIIAQHSLYYLLTILLSVKLIY